MASISTAAKEAPSLGSCFHDALIERTKAQRRNCQSDLQNLSQRAGAVATLNSNGNSETKEPSIGASVTQNTQTAIRRPGQGEDLFVLLWHGLRNEIQPAAIRIIVEDVCVNNVFIVN